MNPNKHHHSNTNRKAKALKLTVVDFTSSNNLPFNNKASNDSNNEANSKAKVMTSKYTEYFSNNSKPFQVISFPFKSNRIQKPTCANKKKHHATIYHQNQQGAVLLDKNGNINNTNINSGEDSVASLHQDRIESFHQFTPDSEPSTPTSTCSSSTSSSLIPNQDSNQKRQRRTSITIRELLNYD